MLYVIGTNYSYESLFIYGPYYHNDPIMVIDYTIKAWLVSQAFIVDKKRGKNEMYYFIIVIFIVLEFSPALTV